MQAVGRIGSYISKSVYTVSGTFHPFGGAVDIIVVEQPDGSYKSSPWYVRFGKFQGVLKSKEKVVGISVNDVEADFHMHLDSKGEAFFMQEVDVEEGESAASPPYSSGEDNEGQPRWPLKSKSCNYDSGLLYEPINERKALTRASTRQAHFFGLFGRRPPAEDAVQGKENEPDVNMEGSLEVAEMAADLLDLRWSTNLPSPKCKRDNPPTLPDADTLVKAVNKSCLSHGSSRDEISLISQTSYQELKSKAEANGVEIKCLTSEYVVSSSVDSVQEHTTLSKLEPMIAALGLDKSDLQLSSVSVSEATKSDIDDSIARLNSLSDANFLTEENERDNAHSFYSSEISGSSAVELDGSSEAKSPPFCHGECRDVCIHSGDQFALIHEEKISVSEGTNCGASESTVTDCYSQSVSRHLSIDSLKETDSQKDKLGSSSGPLYDPDIQRCSVPPSIGVSRVSEEELLLFGNLDGLDLAAKEADSLVMIRVAGGAIESCDAKCCSISSLDQSEANDYMNDVCLDNRRLGPISGGVRIKEIGNGNGNGNGIVESEVPIRTAKSLPSMVSFNNNFEAGDPSYSTNASLCPDVDLCADKNHQLPGAQRIAGEPAKLGHPPRSVDTLGGCGRTGHYRRSTATKIPDVTNSSENADVLDISNDPGEVESRTGVAKVKVNKKKIKTLTPTSKQLASLHLKEGKNVVIFTFSTAMLGKQQVDARIFLWRWDTKIVISDVDGTITRSDLLGQVMPLVGMDWSQTGVAHLFSAIKENGYQLLFLSARSISQSYITRQFLLNIKQDGKALPDGPVVISPDGLFPSLFREVVRRAPHEFKIACLEDIRALFPPDRNPNPFYAGFGNRDTDEVSYLKVGIPLGKIFIINPKGEIAVNRHIETKSYVTLHSLVNGMFPNMFTSEQEDFNSWNFWKIPPPSIDN